MVSIKKRNKLRNCYGGPSVLKNKHKGPKKFVFYTSSLRKMLKKIKNDEWQE